MQLDADMDDPIGVIKLLFAIAEFRLRPGGRLVFWLPSKAFVSHYAVCNFVEPFCFTVGSSLPTIPDTAGVSVCGKYVANLEQKLFELERVTPDKLNDSLWRWLCVFQRI